MKKEKNENILTMWHFNFRPLNEINFKERGWTRISPFQKQLKYILECQNKTQKAGFFFVLDILIICLVGQ